jgi:CDP-6-deoxy-D-xylo-4-hexulose-3-dehydrase
MFNFSYYKKDNIKVNKSSHNWKNFKNSLVKVFTENNVNRRKKSEIKLMEPTFDCDEILAANEVLISRNVTMGEKVKLFEKNYAKMFNYKYSVSCNSGSSANLLALSVLTDPGFRKLSPGDEVIVSAYSWSTTIWPIVQRGLVPVFVDIDPDTLNIDAKKISNAISKKTKAIMLVHTYGNPCEMNEIIKIAKRKKLLLIEDCCEAMGAIYKNKYVGSFGDVSTFSFYFSHHITTLEGGICITKSKYIKDLLKIQRSHGWIREIEDKKKYKKYFKKFDEKFLFMNEGYNLRITEMQAAIGIVQLKKLNKFISVRRRVAKNLNFFFKGYSDYISLQREEKNSKNSYFGFAIIVKKNNFFKIKDLINYLNSKKIETRPIICGNFSKQPGMQNYNYRISGNLKNADFLSKNSFSIGCHQNIDIASELYIKKCFKNFFRKFQ